MAEMAEIFPLFRYFSVSSVIDKDNSQSDWREDFFYNGRNGNFRKINGKRNLWDLWDLCEIKSKNLKSADNFSTV